MTTSEEKKRERGYYGPRARRARLLRARGMEVEDIAEKMGITKKTVSAYTSRGERIYDKWDEEKLDKLIHHWKNDRLSISEIAYKLNATPNAVIGKIWRLKKAGILPKKRPIRIPFSYRPPKSHPFRRRLNP